MLEARRLATFTFICLLAFTSVSAAAGQRAIKPANHSGKAIHQSDARFISSLSAIAPQRTSPAKAQPADFCQSAPDIGGVFCAIGCPNDGCHCNYGSFVSQCCCLVT
jgi:hypothetical protein